MSKAKVSAVVTEPQLLRLHWNGSAPCELRSQLKSDNEHEFNEKRRKGLEAEQKQKKLEAEQLLQQEALLNEQLTVATAGEWDCEVCTFVNEANVNTYNMCGAGTNPSPPSNNR